MDDEREAGRSLGADGPGSQVALVAGGSAGIGLATARALLQSGVRVAIGGRSAERLDSALSALDAGERAIGVILDVTDEKSCVQATSRVSRHMGAVDILVYSVGNAPGGRFDDVPITAWAGAFDAKVIGAVRMLGAVAPGMIKRGYGRIVTIAGTAGTEPDEWMAVPGSVNAALSAAMKSASRALAKNGITVNTVCPGPTATSRWEGLLRSQAQRTGSDAESARAALLARIPVGAPAEPADVANLIRYLVTDAPSHLTGASLAIDGGQSWHV